MTDVVLKQFIPCILSNLIYWNFNVSAFTAVAAIHLTHHHSGVNTELTIAYNLHSGVNIELTIAYNLLVAKSF